MRLCMYQIKPWESRGAPHAPRQLRRVFGPARSYSVGTFGPIQNAPTIRTLSARRVAALESAAFDIWMPDSLATALPDTTLTLPPAPLPATLAAWAAVIDGGYSAAVKTDINSIEKRGRTHFEWSKLHLRFADI